MRLQFLQAGAAAVQKFDEAIVLSLILCLLSHCPVEAPRPVPGLTEMKPATVDFRRLKDVPPGFEHWTLEVDSICLLTG